ncbi:MAG TPA: hypothetical protein PKD32_04920 [Saprospiraceae bacterium]|nr:hypothetical protein [Saprospiraceae bacterium]
MADKSNQNLKAAMIIGIMALLGLNVYQFVNNRSLQNDNLVKENELEMLDKAKTDLEKQYQDAMVELNDMKTNNAELNTLIDSQKEELRIQKDKISSLLKDSKNLGAAKVEMANMKTKLQDYLAQITKLKEENAVLTSANEGLQQDKQSLTMEVEKKSAENAQLTEAKRALSTEKETLSSEKTALAKRVNRAAVIPVAKIDVEAFEDKDGKKPNSVTRAKNTDFLRVCFNTTKNMNTDAGSEAFFVRVINPIGEIQAIEAQGSGVMKSESTGDNIRYSTKFETDYQNEEKKVCGDWKNPGAFEKGTYQVEVYNKGYLVGTSSIKLK